jgi:hypothetical protein
MYFLLNVNIEITGRYFMKKTLLNDGTDSDGRLAVERI